MPILGRSESSGPRPPASPIGDAYVTLVIACGALVLFVATLCPTIYVEDSAEFSTAAAVVGLPHPPGYPLYSLLSAMFVRAVPLGNIGYRSNLLSAVFGAAAVTALWVFLRRLSIGRVAAITATLCFALGATFWSQCLAAEVHTLNCLLLVTALLTVLEAVRHPSSRTFAVCGVSIGLLVGHRNLNALYVAALVVALEVWRRRRGTPVRLVAAFVGGAVATTLVYIYLPITAWRDPALNMGAPSSIERFVTVVTAHSYFRHFASGPAVTDANRLLHFVGRLPRELNIAALAAPIGVVVWRRRSGRLLPAAVSWIVLSCIAFASLYNVIDVEAYFLPACLGIAVLAAFGFDAWRSRFRVVLPFIAAMAIPLNLASVSLHGMDVAGRYGIDLVRSAPPGAVVISFGDTATHVLWYEQAVERFRPDVVVVSFDEVSSWYVDQLARRHPDVDWPPADIEPRWLVDFVKGNLAKRHVCLTHPFDPGIPDQVLVPAGLLFCVRPIDERPSLAASVDFWRDTPMPVFSSTRSVDVHAQMIAFSYATSRFSLAGALADSGDDEGARVQLRAVIAADPNRAERAIVKSMTEIGRVRGADFDLDERASRALLVPNGDAASLRRLLRL